MIGSGQDGQESEVEGSGQDGQGAAVVTTGQDGQGATFITSGLVMTDAGVMVGQTFSGGTSILF